VTILAFDGVTMIDVAGPSDVFGHASRLGADYELRVVSPDGQPVRTASGTTLGVDGPADRPQGTVLVPGAYGMVDFPFTGPLIDAVRQLVAEADRITSVCTGSFLLAEIGLLDDRMATTHWRQVERFTQRYPKVHVVPDALFVRDGDVVTSAGVSSGIDLALSLVEDDHGSDLAAEVARAMVVFMQRPGGQSQFSAPSRAHVGRDSPLRTLLDAVAADPADRWTVSTMATKASVSPRQLSRLFHDEIGTTPARYVELVRLEAAQDLLSRGHTVASAAARSGFGSDETLRRVFVQRLGVTPGAYRAQH
jgi:transcriptional regulator GlxA family with amidase domain